MIYVKADNKSTQNWLIVERIDKNGIIEQGNHSELIKKNGGYANLYQYQFKD